MVHVFIIILSRRNASLVPGLWPGYSPAPSLSYEEEEPLAREDGVRVSVTLPSSEMPQEPENNALPTKQSYRWA
ncbi:hypothetical protein MHYP_G00191200 [Metynnis hypsauchen]